MPGSEMCVLVPRTVFAYVCGTQQQQQQQQREFEAEFETEMDEAMRLESSPEHLTHIQCYTVSRIIIYNIG